MVAVGSAGPIRRRICVRQQQDPSAPPIAGRRTNGFWLRTLEPPHCEESEYRIVSRSGLALDDRVHFPTSRFGTAGIVLFTRRKDTSSWSHIRWISVGFDDEFKPVIILANHALFFGHRDLIEDFRRANEASAADGAPKMHRFRSDWIRDPHLSKQQEVPTFKNAWPRGYYVQRVERMEEGGRCGYLFEGLDLRLRVSLTEDIDPHGSRGAVVGAVDSSPRYIWTLDFERAAKDSHYSPESHHWAEMCLTIPKCMVGVAL